MVSPKIHTLRKPHGNRQWAVRFYENKKRRQRYFCTEREARAFVRELERNIQKRVRIARDLSPDEIEDYLKAKKLAGSLGVAEMIERLLIDAKTAPAATGAPIIDTAHKFLAEKARAQRSKIHINHLRARIEAFAAHFKTWSGISEHAFMAWLLKRGAPRTIKNVYCDVSNFCAYAQRRGWISSNPIQNVHADDLPRVVKGKIGILTPTELRTFLAHVEEAAPQYLPYFWVQAFAGIRNAEAQRLRWDMIDTKRQTITLDASIVKTRDAWTMRDLPPILWRKLSRHKHGAKWEAPSDWEEAQLHLSVPWKPNCLRHSFATYHLSLYGDAPRTSLLLRHTNPRQLYQSYLSALVPKDVAGDYFA